MNPATDAGKQKLPIRVRSKFTGFVVSEPSEPEQLSVIVKNYLPAISATHLQLIVQFYTEILVLLPRKFRYASSKPETQNDQNVPVCAIFVVPPFSRVTTSTGTRSDRSTKAS